MPGSPDDVVVLVNPVAGRGRAQRVGEQVVAALRLRRLPVVVLRGHDRSDARELAGRALEARPRVLVVVGGDGTLSGVLDLVCAAGTPVAVVPAGTGNDFCRALDLPDDPVEIAAMVDAGRTRRVDVAEIRWTEGIRPFLTVAAFGLDARISERTNRLRWPRGPLRYYLALVIELVRLAPVAFRILGDGAAEERPGTLMAVCNTASYGGGMPISPIARPDDGLLDVVHVRPLSRRHLLRVFPLLLRGAHLGRPEVTAWTTTVIEVEAPDAIAYADGERVGSGPFQLGVRPAALTVLVPDAVD